MVFWLPLRQSRWLYCLCWLQHGCAVLALWHVDAPLALRLCVLSLIVLHSRRQTLLPQALLFDSRAVQLVYAGQRVAACLGAQCYCSELLVVLRVEPEQGVLEDGLPGSTGRGKRWLVLLPDSSTPDALRRLRIYLRWHAQSST